MHERNTVFILRLLGIVALLVFGRAIVHYMMLPGGGPGALFGSIHAPYSDALGPWLYGGIMFHLYGTIDESVYRPTLALFYASAFALANRIEVIPVASAVLLHAVLVLVLLVRTPRRATLAVILTLAILGVAHRTSLAHLSIGSINVDFPLFALIFCGVVLIVIALDDDETDRPLLLAGFLCLGVGAALRGTVLLGGLLSLSLLALVRPRVPPRSMALLALAFLAPSAVDSILARQHGTLNNGVIALFCVYDDPLHSWTAACHDRYLAKQPATAEVTAGYTKFVLSAPGARRVGGSVHYRLQQDGPLAQTNLFLACAAGLLGMRTWQQRRRSGGWRAVARDRALALGWAVLALLVAGRAGPPDASPIVLAAVLGLALIGSLLLRMRAAAIALFLYVGGIATLAMLFLTIDRVGASFAFCLTLGLLLILAGPSDARTIRPSAHQLDALASSGAATLVAFAIAFLYLGHYVMPSPAREAFRYAVDGKQTALKLSDDHDLGLSLYLFSGGHLGYAVLDDVPLGAVRAYERLEPGSLYNVSFEVPNQFVGVR